MDDGVFASIRMTEAVIKNTELESKRKDGRKKIRGQKKCQKQNVSLLRGLRIRLWVYYYKSMARLQGTP